MYICVIKIEKRKREREKVRKRKREVKGELDRRAVNIEVVCSVGRGESVYFPGEALIFPPYNIHMNYFVSTNRRDRMMYPFL